MARGSASFERDTGFQLVLDWQDASITSLSLIPFDETPPQDDRT